MNAPLRGLRPSSADLLRLALIALLAHASLLGLACSRPGPQRNALLITIDTLRADYVHAYGFAHASTPRIDALAARGGLFESAIAAATVTAPAHASIMTSRYARQHSIGPLNGETRLEGGQTLAERFSEAGYDTAAFVSNVVLRRRSGLDRGFDVYDDELVIGEQNRHAYFERVAADTASRALEWLSARPDSRRPFFLWVHLQDPHGPYTPPDEYRGRIGEVALRAKRPIGVLAENKGRAGIPQYQKLEGLRRPGEYAGRYAEEILYADHWVGEVVEAVEQQSGETGAVVLLTADHGESMGEDGFFFQHGQSTTPDLARVPLIVAAPQIGPGRFDVPVSHVDVAPTLLELAGLTPLRESSGVSLAPLLRGGRPPGERLIFCDIDGEAAAYAPRRFTRAGGPGASARIAGAPPPLRFETQRETASGEWRPDDLARPATEALERYIAAAAPLAAADAMDAEHVEQLRALGYLPPVEESREPEAASRAE